jgi:succinoglycan biosynthesis transport protein ExoP
VHQTSEFISLLRSAWRHKFMIIIASVGAAALAFIISYFVPKTYEGKTTFTVSNMSTSGSLIDRLTSQFGDLGALVGLSSSKDNNVGLAEEILKSRAFVTKIINELGLNWDEQTIDKFRKDYLFVNVLSTGAMQVRVWDRDPEVAAAIANGLVNTFVREQKSYLKYGSTRTRDFVAEQFKEAETRLNNAREAVLKVQKEEGIFSESEQFNSYASALNRAENLRAETKIQIAVYQTKLAEIQEKLKDQPQFREASRSFTLSPEYQELTRRLRSLELELLDAQLKYTDQHPTVIELKAQIATTMEQLAGTAREHVSSRVESTNPVYTGMYEDALTTEIQIIAAETNLKELEKQLQMLYDKADTLADKGSAYAKAKLELQIAQEIYVLMATEYESAKLSAEQDSEIVRVIDPAIVPYSPAKPKKVVNAFIGGAIAFIVSLSAAYIVDNEQRQEA